MIRISVAKNITRKVENTEKVATKIKKIKNTKVNVEIRTNIGTMKNTEADRKPEAEVEVEVGTNPREGTGILAVQKNRDTSLAGVRDLVLGKKVREEDEVPRLVREVDTLALAVRRLRGDIIDRLYFIYLFFSSLRKTAFLR